MMTTRESRDGACMRGEMSFPARGNLRLVAIGGSKLAREAIGTRRAAPTKRGRRGRRTKLCAGTTGGGRIGGREGKVRSRRATAVAAATVERKREGPLVARGAARETRGTDGRPPGIIAAGVVLLRSGGLTT